MNKPREVENAVTLSYLLLAVSCGVALLQYPFDPRTVKIPNGLPILTFLLFISACITLFLLYKTNRQRNWARVTLLVLFCISAPGLFTSIGGIFKNVPLFGFIHLFVTGAEIYCLILLFSAPANRWFAEYQKPSEGPKVSLGEIEGQRRMMGIYEKQKWENR